MPCIRIDPGQVGNAHTAHTHTQYSHNTHTAPALHSNKLRCLALALPVSYASQPARPFFVLNCFVYDFVPQLAFLIRFCSTLSLTIPPTPYPLPSSPFPLPACSELLPSAVNSNWRRVVVVVVVVFPAAAFGLVLRFCLFALWFA